MNIKLILKSGAVLLTALLLVAVGIAYGVTVISRGVEGFVSVTAEISIDEAIGLYHVHAGGNPGAPLTTADFGTISLDPFGTATPTEVLTVWVENGTGTSFKLTVDDQSAGVGGIDTFQIGEIVYAPSGQPLSTMPDPEIVLVPGQLVLLDLSLEFSDVVIGDYGLTVRFNAEEILQSAPTPDGLVGWWPGDGDSDDLSPNNNHGTITGDGTFVPGMVGQAFSFGGTGFVEIPYDPVLDLNHFTIELWVNPATVDSGYQALVGKGFSPYAASLWLFNDKVEVWFDPLQNPKVLSITSLTPSQWYHLAATYDGAEVNIYIDGSLDATALSEVVPVTTFGRLFLGVNEGGLWYDGLLDEVSIYNRALTGEEISTIYAAGSHGKTRPEPPPPLEVIVDNEDPDFRIFSEGWALVNYNDAYNGTYHVHNPGTADDWVTFSADLPEGNYEVYASWVAGANRATDAPYTIPPNRTTVRVNQTINGGRFNLLGTFSILGGIVIVELTADGDGLVIADTVRFVQIEADP